MANTMPSINMNLPIPTVGIDPGPDWALNIDSCFSILDSHDHTPGKGIPITPTGININADLLFNNNNATLVRSIRFQPQGGVLVGGADLGCIYESGVDLFYNDGAGNNIRITQSGGIAGTPGSIGSLTPPASVTYVSGTSTYVFQSAANTPGNIDVASVVLRNLTAGSNGLTLSPPASLPSDYSIILPSLPAQTSFVTITSSGTMLANTTIDGQSIVNTAGVLSSTIEYQFQANGQYRVGNFVDGLMPFNSDATIKNIWIYNLGAGVSGTTEFDLKTSAPGGSFTSILSTTGKITSAAAGNIWTDSGSIVGSQTGVTKPVIGTTSISAGNVIRFDLLTVMPGAANCGVIIQYL